MAENIIRTTPAGRLAGRRVLVTGAASGIGLATAELFLAEGARVAMLDRDGDGLAGATARLGAVQRRPATAVADVADEAAVGPAVAALAEALGGLDGVVNAAGMDLLKPFDEMSASEWERVIAVNLSGPCQVCRAALAALKQAGRGTVVNIASGAALRPLEGRTAYCAAKAGLVMLSKTLAVDLAPYNVRVNAICPGIIDTPMFRASYQGAPDPQASFAKIMERYVIKRVGHPADIAYAALYLTSEESAYVTGVALAVDGGRTFH
jgi:NAD(P)-dependent dehydrogenase (short-subunit alcohol dehydrogenase family)